MKYGSWTLGQIEALLNRLGEDNARTLLDHSEVTVTFDAGDKLATIIADAQLLQVWRTVNIGNGIKNGEDFCSKLDEKDILNGGWAREMLNLPVFTVATAEEDVDLVKLSVANLGFEEGARYDAICARAIELGLELCPAEVGPQLRLQYPDQLSNEWLVIAMKAIRSSDGLCHVFSLTNGFDGRCLRSYDGFPSSFLAAWYEVVFRAPASAHPSLKLRTAQQGYGR